MQEVDLLSVQFGSGVQLQDVVVPVKTLLEGVVREVVYERILNLMIDFLPQCPQIVLYAIKFLILLLHILMNLFLSVLLSVSQVSQIVNIMKVIFALSNPPIKEFLWTRHNIGRLFLTEHLLRKYPA